MNIKISTYCFLLFVICLSVSCQKDRKLKRMSERNISQWSAKRIIKKVKIGMTVDQVMKTLNVEEYEVSRIIEHGGDWLKFKISKNYIALIRFTKDCMEQNDKECVVNSKPTLNLR